MQTKSLKFHLILSVLLTVTGYAQVSSQEVERSIYMTANTSDTNTTDVLSEIASQAKSSSNATLLLLGNAAPKTKFKSALDQQFELIKGFKKDAIFIVGSQEWSFEGYKRTRNVEKYIQKNSKAKFYPNNGEPLKKHDISENIVLITVDSQWFLEDWNDQIYINDDSEIQNRTLFFLEFQNLVKKAQGKIILVAMHHPIDTNTKHGFWANTGGFSIKDFQNKQYQKLRNRLKTVARGTNNIVFLSGHDKNLQYLNKGVPQIISGAAGETENVKKAGSVENFALAKRGYVRIDIARNGSVKANFYTVENKTSQQVFSTTVLKEEKSTQVTYDFKSRFPTTQSASIYTKEAVSKGGFYKALWGEHYREFYGKQVNAPVVDLDTLMGGVTPLKRGGGQQSKSLRLQDKNGRQFVMRALKKSTLKFLQANAFQDTYIGNLLDNTVVDKFLSDFYTTSHPYTPFVIGDLSNPIGVYHTNPKLYYIPKQEVLGEFNDEFGDELYMIEEHVGDTQIETESFGKPKKILSTTDMLQEINRSGKVVVDEPSYIKARLFDMLLGDWDRHEDQWRWALFENEQGKKYYEPIPRDRDQAFSKYDGGLLNLLTRAVPGLRKMQSYDTEIRSVKWFAASPYHLDLTLINASGLDEWEKQAKYIQENLSDDDIERAFEEIPKEIKGATIEDIKRKLKGRRGNLLDIARAYYSYLNEFEVITGTQKSDNFIITRLSNGETNIKIDRKELGILDRTFSNDITKEIWIYGLNGKDSFVVKGEGNKPIKIRIIGGKKNDTYDFKNTKNVKLYDYKSKENTIINSSSKKWLVDDYDINNYDHKKVKHSFNQLLPLIGVNPDDGLKVGLVSNHTFYGLQSNPFTYRHSIRAAYYTSTSGIDVSYNGELSNIFHHWNFGMESSYSSPAFAENFFGFGNESTYNSDVNDLNFNRARIRKWNAAVSLNWRGVNGGHFQLKPLVESFNVEDTEGRFLVSLASDNSVFENQVYAGVESGYNYSNKDNTAFPTLGLDMGIKVGYKTNIDATDNENSFGYIMPAIVFDHKLTNNGSLVLASKLGGTILLGSDFEFYHGARIGGNKGLRGFRNQRFTGKYSFYQNTDLRMMLGGLRTSVVPIRFGITGSFDHGRVWVENDSSKKWHNSVGASLWVVGAEALTANLGYFNSTDGGRIVFVLGFSF